MVKITLAVMGGILLGVSLAPLVWDKPKAFACPSTPTMVLRTESYTPDGQVFCAYTSEPVYGRPLKYRAFWAKTGKEIVAH